MNFGYLRYCSRVAQTATDFADASHAKSAKSVTTTVLYGIFSSENAYPCTVTHKQQRFIDIFRQNVYDKAIKICNETLIFRISERGML